MKNKFYKKVFWGIILIVVFGLISAGCGGTGGGGGTPIPLPPTTCTVIVTSQAGFIWGIVYMDGNAVPSGTLFPWGSVQIDNVSVGVRHTIWILRGNLLSHSMFITPVFGTNYVDFYWF